jgi:hypothetical protein
MHRADFGLMVRSARNFASASRTMRNPHLARLAVWKNCKPTREGLSDAQQTRASRINPQIAEKS